MNKTVLIIDDEPDIQEILAAYLERIDGVAVVSALSGEEGVEKFRQLSDDDASPAMVVMDLNLSGSNADEAIIDAHRSGQTENMDGVRATRTILNLDSTAVIWGYTAWADTAWGDRLRDAGAARVVDRIVPFKEFADMVGQELKKQ